MSVSTTVANATESYCFPLHSHTLHAFAQRLLIAVSEWLNSSGLLWPFMRFQCPSVWQSVLLSILGHEVGSPVTINLLMYWNFFPVPIHTSGRQSIVASNSTCSSSQFICPSVQSLQIVVGVFFFSDLLPLLHKPMKCSVAKCGGNFESTERHSDWLPQVWSFFCFFS